MFLKNNINLFAVGLHSFGGLSILKALLNKKYNNIYLDNRIKKHKINTISNKITFIKSYSYKRILTEKKLSKKNGISIYGNGLPPIFRSKSYIYCIFQNANIFREFYQIKFHQWLFSLDSLRYLYFKLFKKNVDCWIVLSPLASQIIKSKVSSYIPVQIYNVFDQEIPTQNIAVKDKLYDFIYPASGLSHKNHKLILESLIELAKKKIFPKVLLTLNDKEKKKFGIEKIKMKFSLNIDCKYYPDKKEFNEIYKRSKILLYVSKNETLALPILEAYQHGLIIIAPKAMYSNQFLMPDLTFEQSSVHSLTETMLKALNQKDVTPKKFSKIDNFSNFLKKL